MDLSEMNEKYPGLSEKGKELDETLMMLRKQLRDALEQNEQMRQQLISYQEGDAYQEAVMDGIHLMERNMLNRYNISIVDGVLLDHDTGYELKQFNPEFSQMSGMRPVSKEELEQAQKDEQAEAEKESDQ
jgi:hypothetical protein